MKRAGTKCPVLQGRPCGGIITVYTFLLNCVVFGSLIRNHIFTETIVKLLPSAKLKLCLNNSVWKGAWGACVSSNGLVFIAGRLRFTFGPHRACLVTQQISVLHIRQQSQSQPLFFCRVTSQPGHFMASPVASMA